MELRYGMIDENVRKRSVMDIILHERQKTGGILDSRGDTRWQGMLAVLRAANRLAADRIRPERFCPCVLLPAGTEEKSLRDLYRQMCRTAFPAGLDVTGGHAEVTDAVNRPVVIGRAQGRPFGKAEGSGENKCGDKCSPTSFTEASQTPQYVDAYAEKGGEGEGSGKSGPDRTGWEIVAAGETGLEGSFLLSSLFRRELQERFPSSLLMRMDMLSRRLFVLQSAQIAAEQDACMVNLSAGGFFAGLWKLAEKTGCGLTVDLQAVPILQETIEITEYFGIHPYMMRSEGSLLAAAPDGEKLAEQLIQAGIPACRIGTLENTRDKIIRNGEEIRNLDRPQTDALDLYLYQRGQIII